MTGQRDDLVQQLAEVIAAANAYQVHPWDGFARLPAVHQLRYLDIARAVLASGLVVPAVDLAGARSDHEYAWGQLNEQTAKLEKLRADAHALAQQWDRDTSRARAGLGHTYAAELRALVNGDTP